MAAADQRLLAITPAMREGSGLVRFSREFPQRYFDVGIAEQHAVTLAAGMACEGAKPVVAIYSTFLQRAYDQLIHDVALQNLDVMFAIDRGGLVGPDGPTHAGSFDLSYLRCIPNMVVMAPSDEDECRRMLTTAFLHDGPTAVRYPRGAGTGRRRAERARDASDRQGRSAPSRTRDRTARVRRDGRARGTRRRRDRRHARQHALCEAARRSAARRARGDARRVRHDRGQRGHGGAGSGVAECFSAHGLTPALLHLGLADGFLDHGSREELLALAGLDAASIESAIRARFGAFMPADLRNVG